MTETTPATSETATTGATPAAGFARACALADIPDSNKLGVVVDGVPIVVVRTHDEIHALHDECTHAQVALSEGEVDGAVIDCWLHGAEFDLRTGAALSLPATEPVAIYPVKIDGDAVLVNVHAPIEQES